jgi:lipid A 3-O-deacylase
MSNFIRLSFCFFFFHIPAIYSQNVPFKNELGFQSDNDAYLAVKQDRYYTNGLFITFRHAINQSKPDKRVNKKIWEAELGQRIYNPKSGNVTKINDTDRPFAAYLYGGAGFNWLYNSEHSLRLSLQTGVMGPGALGEEVQEMLHKFVGFYNIAGWENQLHNEFAVNASLAYNYFLQRNKAANTDVSLTSYLNAGNTFAGAGLGVLFRTGRINEFYNSVSNNSVISNNASSAPLHNREFFFFLRPTLHFVAYDATIEGGMFTEDKGPITFNQKPVVFSQELGVNHTSNRWTLNFSLTFKSKEVQSAAKAHQFGTASIYYRFK